MDYCEECGSDLYEGHYTDCSEHDAEAALMEAAYGLMEERELGL